MTLTQLPIMLLLVMSLAAIACGRTERADDAPAGAPVASDTKDEDAAALDRRLDALERKWEEVRNRVAKETTSATATAREEIEKDFTAVREAVAELRTTTAQNWWERQERQLERAAEDVEQNVRRLARNWNPPGETAEVATSGSQTDWRARRDALVARMEARVRSMEEALEGLDPRSAGEQAVGSARARVEQMKEDTARVRNASEADWWEMTKARANAALERLEAAIDRLAEGRV